MAYEEDEPYGYLSDESDFYGDAKTREELEERTRSLDIEKWFENHKPSLTTKADANKGSTDPRAHMRNPYEGLVQARQLSESVDEFLKRLVPSKTNQSPEIPWIRIANPFLPYKNKEKTIDDDVLDEGPLLGDSNLQNFIAKGKSVLQELRVAIDEVKNFAGLSVEQRYQATCKPREEAVEAVKSAAKEHGVTGGKWILPASIADVDVFWSAIAKATAENDLGTAAKVLLYNPSIFFRTSTQFLYVYTADFSNVDDVTRVLRKMKKLGLWSNRRDPIHYTPDAFAYLKIESGNEWGIDELLYRSDQLIPPKSRKN